MTREEPTSRVGDLWLLGRHRVLCAGATKSDNYTTLFGDVELARAVFSDPPYNIKIDGFAVGAQKHKEFVAASGEMTDDEFVKLDAGGRLEPLNHEDTCMRVVYPTPRAASWCVLWYQVLVM
jgi:hypothetical protein